MNSFFENRVSLLDKIFLAKMLAMMFKTGVAVDAIFEALIAESHGSLQRLLKRIAVDIGAGAPLAEAFAKHEKALSPLFVNLIKSGEASGTLDENLERLTLQLAKDYETRKTLWGAASYPLFIFIAGILLSISLVVFVLPRLLPIFSDLNVELPLLTRVLIWLSHFFSSSFSALFFLGLGVVVIGGAWITRTTHIRNIIHPLLVSIPVVGPIVRVANAARFSRTLYTLLKSGTPVDESMRIVSNVIANHAYRKDIAYLLRSVEEGLSIGNAMRKIDAPSRWPSPLIRILAVGEESGRLEEALLYLADFYDAEVAESTKKATAIVEPLLIVIIGFFVLMIALAILTPIYQLTGSLR